jgi:hypothetical protein
MTCEQKERFEKAVEMLRPDAKEFTETMLNDPIKTTQNNYGRVMAFLSGIKSPAMAQLFLIAMVREGYPKQTADTLRQIMGWAK